MSSIEAIVFDWRKLKLYYETSEYGSWVHFAIEFLKTVGEVRNLNQN